MTRGHRELANRVLWPGFLGARMPEELDREGARGLAGVVLFGHNTGTTGRIPQADEGGERGPAGAAPWAADASAPDAGAAPWAGRAGFLVGIDEEGGNVTRLEAAGGSTLPGALQLGTIDDTDLTRAVARELGRRAASIGANVVAAPVADVNTNPLNPVIGPRAFGADPDLVARHVAAAVRGFLDAGVAPVAKHFPGHGDTAVDSHHGLPVASDASLAAALRPFAAAVDAGVPAIMTAHLVVPAWGPEPATLNARALAELRALGFEGVIVSDALDMAAVRSRYGAGGAAVRALAAGCDLLCIGNPAITGAADQDVRDFLEVRDAVAAALDDGTLPRARVEDAAGRVAALAARFAGGAPGRVSGGAVPAALDLTEIGRRAASIEGRVPPMPGPRTVLDVRSVPTIAVDARAETVARIVAAGGPLVRAEGADEAGRAAGAVVAAERVAAAAGGADAAMASARASARLVVLVDRLADSAQRAAVAAVAARRPDAIVVDFGVPAGPPVPLPVVHVRAASRLAAETADRLLAEGAAG